jgi:hypothetical protein
MSTIEGNFSTTTFEYRSRTGGVIDSYELVPGSGAEDDTPANVYFGNTTIPDSSFFIYAVGHDSMGNPYQRLLRGGLLLSSLNSTSTPPISSSAPSSSLYLSLSLTPSSSLSPNPSSALIHNYSLAVSSGAPTLVHSHHSPDSIVVSVSTSSSIHASAIHAMSDSKIPVSSTPFLHPTATSPESVKHSSLMFSATPISANCNYPNSTIGRQMRITTTVR